MVFLFPVSKDLSSNQLRVQYWCNSRTEIPCVY